MSQKSALEPTPDPKTPRPLACEPRPHAQKSEHRTSNIEHRTSNIQSRTSKVEHPKSKAERPTPNRRKETPRRALLLFRREINRRHAAIARVALCKLIQMNRAWVFWRISPCRLAIDWRHSRASLPPPTSPWTARMVGTPLQYSWASALTERRQSRFQWTCNGYSLR